MIKAVAGDPGVGATQSEQWFVDGGDDPLVNETREMLIEGLDQQPDMEVAPALLVSDQFEELLEPLDNTLPEANQGEWGAITSFLDAPDKKLVLQFDKHLKGLAAVLKDMQASSDGAVNEIADDIEDAITLLSRKLKIMKGL